MERFHNFLNDNNVKNYINKRSKKYLDMNKKENEEKREKIAKMTEEFKNKERTPEEQKQYDFLKQLVKETNHQVDKKGNIIPRGDEDEPPLVNTDIVFDDIEEELDVKENKVIPVKAKVISIDGNKVEQSPEIINVINNYKPKEPDYHDAYGNSYYTDDPGVHFNNKNTEFVANGNSKFTEEEGPEDEEYRHFLEGIPYRIDDEFFDALDKVRFVIDKATGISQEKKEEIYQKHETRMIIELTTYGNLVTMEDGSKLLTPYDSRISKLNKEKVLFRDYISGTPRVINPKTPKLSDEFEFIDQESANVFDEMYDNPKLKSLEEVPDVNFGTIEDIYKRQKEIDKEIDKGDDNMIDKNILREMIYRDRQENLNINSSDDEIYGGSFKDVKINGKDYFYDPYEDCYYQNGYSEDDLPPGYEMENLPTLEKFLEKCDPDERRYARWIWEWTPDDYKDLGDGNKHKHEKELKSITGQPDKIVPIEGPIERFGPQPSQEFLNEKARYRVEKDPNVKKSLFDNIDPNYFNDNYESTSEMRYAREVMYDNRQREMMKRDARIKIIDLERLRDAIRRKISKLNITKNKDFRKLEKYNKLLIDIEYHINILMQEFEILEEETKLDTGYKGLRMIHQVKEGIGSFFKGIGKGIKKGFKKFTKFVSDNAPAVGAIATVALAAMKLFINLKA